MSLAANYYRENNKGERTTVFPPSNMLRRIELNYQYFPNVPTELRPKEKTRKKLKHKEFPLAKRVLDWCPYQWGVRAQTKEGCPFRADKNVWIGEEHRDIREE